MKNITLSFVVPMYNEEKRIGKTLKALREFDVPQGVTLEKIIFINDGSQDKSKVIIQKLKGKLEKKLKCKVRLISYRYNKGKGYAVRQGMLASDSDYTLFFDADMSTPLTEIKKFVPHMRKGIDFVIGTRKNGKSTVIKHQPVYRELLGRGFTLMTQLLLGVFITDFTCGFKALKREAKDEIFPMTQINRWAYDAEIVYYAHINRFSMQEVPVTWANDERTKVNLLTDLPRTLVELFIIRFSLPSLTYSFQKRFIRWGIIKPELAAQPAIR